MKKGLKIGLIILGIIIVVAVISVAIYYTKTEEQEDEVVDIKVNNEETENNIVQMSAIVVKTDDKWMYVIEKDNLSELITIGYKNQEDVEYKQGQEILIYYDGIIMESYPAQLGNIEKIEIVKEDSNIEIPDNILKYCYSSRNNVSAEILELTNTGLALNITDTNELTYNYSNSYKIYKEVKNENYTGVGEKVGETTSSSTAGFTRNRI